MAPHHHRQMGVLVPDGLMPVGPTPICNRRQRAGVTALGRYLPHHILACPRLAPRVGKAEEGRCYDFPTRIPGHLFVSLPGSTLSFSVRVSQLPLALPEGRRGPSGPGQLFNRRPQVSACSRVGVSGISQVPRRSILCLCLELRPRPNRRSLAIGGFVDAAPASSTAKASA